jgi:hypothetical protein
MTRTDARAAVLALAAVAACARAPSTEGPAPSSVEPAVGSAAAPVPVLVRGTRFYVRPVQDVGDGGAWIDAHYRAWLGTVPLDSVTWQDEQTLAAVVPAGIAPGTYALTVEDPFGRRGVLAAAYEATIAPAVLRIGFVDTPARVSLGRSMTATVEVSNAGQASALAVAVSITSSEGDVGTPPGPVDVEGGAAVRVQQSFTPRARGTLVLQASAAGTDASTGAQVQAGPATWEAIVENPADPQAAFVLPDELTTGDLSVVVTVTNLGDALARDVAAGPLQISGVAAEIGPSPPPWPAPLAAGETATFAWPVRLLGCGVATFSTSVTAVDGNDGTALDVPVSAARPVVEATVIATNPFGDGTGFAFVAGYHGWIYLGPSRNGTGLVRMAPDGTGAESLPLSFHVDSTGPNLASNGGQPYASIGYTGCTPDSASNQCGPDDEDGRGLFASLLFGGEEWLVLGGARSSGDLDYVYATRDTGSAPVFSYLDLSALLVDDTHGFGAVRAIGDRVYLGFADDGTERPRGLAASRLPLGDGLDADPTAIPPDAIDLRLGVAFQGATGPTPSAIETVDAFASFGGRVYAFGHEGCLVSRTSAPAGPADFASCSPAASAGYDPSASIALPRAYDLAPRDRAWPATAEWNGRLYAIRNTYVGPQLWSCDPAGGADPAACDPADWSLVAASNGTTSFGDDQAGAATLLVATPRHLWIGLDDAVGGVRVYRTSAAVPTIASDFRGEDDCVAGVASCPGVGGNGLGPPAASRIFDGEALVFGGRASVYLTVGDATGPVSLVRIGD